MFKSIKEKLQSMFRSKLKKSDITLPQEKNVVPLVAITFDDPRFKVITIERENVDGLSESTVIGYYLTDIDGNPIENRYKINGVCESDEGSLKEWYLNITREQHNELIKCWHEHTLDKKRKTDLIDEVVLLRKRLHACEIVLADAYQVVGHMMTIDGKVNVSWTDTDVEKVLDNLHAVLSDEPLPHLDILPWPQTQQTEKHIPTDDIPNEEPRSSENSTV